METKIDSRIIGIIAVMGIMMVVAAIFMNWIAVDDAYAGYSGLQIGDLVDGGDYDDWQQNVPLIVFILGIIMLILEIISLIMPDMSKKIEAIMPSLTFIFGIVIIILCALFACWDLFDEHTVLLVTTDPCDAGAGCWTALVGAVICVICNLGQVIATVKKKEA